MSFSKTDLWDGDSSRGGMPANGASFHKTESDHGLGSLNGSREESPEAPDEVNEINALGAMLQEDDLRRLDLAHRLHKDVAGGLVACTAVGEMIRQEFAQRDMPPHLANLLVSMDATLRQTMQVVRELTEVQVPPVLKAFGLCAALQQLVRDHAEHFVGALVLHIRGDEPVFDAERRVCVYRMLELLLSRCVRNPRTSWAEVTCLGGGDRAEFTIDFDGDEALPVAAGLGGDGQIIEARCALLGASFQATHTPTGRCQRLVLTVPLTDNSPVPQAGTRS